MIDENHTENYSETSTQTPVEKNHYRKITIKMKDGKIIYYRSQEYLLDSDGSSILVGEKATVGGDIKI